jgi:hypothetical protein
VCDTTRLGGLEVVFTRASCLTTARRASPTREPTVQASSCLPNSHIQQFCLLIGETLGCFDQEVQIQTKGLLYGVLDIVRQELVNLQLGAVSVADTTRHIVSLIQSLDEVQDQFSRSYDTWLRPSSMGGLEAVRARYRPSVL